MAFTRMRENARRIAGDIAADLPSFTNHDVEHLDALWELADLLLDPQAAMNPLEAFVLGASFLTHDLAMTLSAYPGRHAALRQVPGWADALQVNARRLLGRSLSADELTSPPPGVESITIQETLRERHATQAAWLATQAWVDPDTGEQFYLLEDQQLRAFVGYGIGQIAASHWWDHEALEDTFNGVAGAPAGLPASWGLDRLKLACLLRTADAAHLDARRAPHLLRVARGLTGPSLQHWKFQGKLLKPSLEEDQLVFWSASPFRRDEAKEWWLCWDAVQVVDHELRRVDDILRRQGRPRLRARSVKGAHAPSALTATVAAEGWQPVPAQIQVSDIPGLVERLGGAALYGLDRRVPLRELVQNAADAVRAARALTGNGNHSVTVRLADINGEAVLEVCDTGIGMTQGTLTAALLDFGTSYWLHSDIRSTYPGLVSRGFDPVGRFGIGFFSVFMLGQRVEVASRPLLDGYATHILSFGRGVEERPILRQADGEEALASSGTRVRVWLDPSARQGLLAGEYGGTLSLEHALQWLFPVFDVRIDVCDERGQRTAVMPESVEEVQSADLFDRLTIGNGSSPWPVEAENRDWWIDRLEPVYEVSGRCVGRLVLAWTSHERTFGAPVVVGGARSKSEFLDWAGLVEGIPMRAARDGARPNVSPEALAAWSTSWGMKYGHQEDPEFESRIAAAIAAVGGSIGDLRCTVTKAGWINLEGVAEWAAARQTVILTDDTELILPVSYRSPPIGPQNFGDNVLWAEMHVRFALQDGTAVGQTAWPLDPCPGRYPHPGSLAGLALRVIAEAWEMEEAQLLEQVQALPRDRYRLGVQMVVAHFDDQPLHAYSIPLTRSK